MAGAAERPALRAAPVLARHASIRIVSLALVLAAGLAGCAATTPGPGSPSTRVETFTAPYAAEGCTSVSVLQHVALDALMPHLPAGFAPRAATHLDPGAPEGTGAVVLEILDCGVLQQTVVAVYVSRPVEGRGLERAFDFLEVHRDVVGEAPFAEVSWPVGTNATRVDVGEGLFGLARAVEASSAAGNVTGTALGAKESGTTTRVWRELPLGPARVTTATEGTFGLLGASCAFPEGSPVRALTGRADCAGARAALGTGVSMDGTLVGLRLVPA